MERKKVIAIDLMVNGHGGGPFTSTSRIMNSSLKDTYDFKVINYDPTLGSKISISRILDIKRQIDDIKPDIVHFTGLQLSAFHIIVACKLAGVKNTVLTIRGMSGDVIFFNRYKKAFLKYVIEPVTLLLVKKFYCVSNYVSNRAIPKLFSYKSFGKIYNYPPFIKQSDGSDIRSNLGISEDDFLVVSVARINKEKGYHILDHAIRQIKHKNKIKFLIVGAGDYLDEMRCNLSEQVEQGQVFFAGKVKNVADYMDCADVFILPTLHETLSVALLEASQSKLPLLASNTGGIPEIVEHGVNGLLMDVGCSKSIVDSVLLLYRDRALAKKMGLNAFEKVNKAFNEALISQEIKCVYEALLRSNDGK